MDVNFPNFFALLYDPLRIDVDDDALAPESVGSPSNQLRIFAGGGELMETLSQPADRSSRMSQSPNASPYGKWHENLVCRSANHIDHDAASLVASRNVEKN